MPYIIGTAGHIDHGKTSLIKALTGQDTDRLKEEKERGISIDLGFAHLDLPDGTQAGIVDVPGHERFIKNMLAGAHGIDLVLFTVAADDGVMPQTEEHLDIVHLLGVNMAIFVITKADLVPPERIEEVREEIKILTLDTLLEDSPVVAASSATGQGLEQHGAVVTGTALSGEVKTGEHVRCLPGGDLFRVRSLQIHGRSVDKAGWGQRVALNLSGPERASIERGHVICHEKLSLTTNRFDAFLEVRPAAAKGIKNHQRIRIHLGTAERLAKIILLGAGDKAGPKESVYCQITLAEPLLALRNDHFIVRDETARKTLAGGIVIHPWAGKHKRGAPDLHSRLESLRCGDTSSLIECYLDESSEFALPVDSIHQFLNLQEEAARSALATIKSLHDFNAEGEKVYTTESKWQRSKNKIIATLGEFHKTHPLVPGMDMEELRGKLPYALSPKIFRAIVDTLTAEKVLAKEENLLHLAEHRVQLGGQEKSMMDRIKKVLGEQPMSPPDLKDIEKQLGVPRGKLAEVIRLLERDGSVIRVATDLYYLSSTVDEVRAVLKKFLSEKGEIAAASFRDLIGSSRKYTIPLLEYFDREGTTIRIGDIRRLKGSASSGR